ncbi:MAG: hypothetical protein U0172_03400 [Nitrospiraceae bacterium]
MAIATSGCINLTTSITPPAGPPLPEAERIENSDCVPIILGIGIGESSVAGAMRGERERIDDDGRVHRPASIRTVHEIRIHDYQFMMFGARCVEVVGTK